MEGHCGLFSIQVERCTKRFESSEQINLTIHLHFNRLSLQQSKRKAGTPNKRRYF